MSTSQTEYRVRQNHSKSTWRIDEKILIPTERSYKLMWVIKKDGFSEKKYATAHVVRLKEFTKNVTNVDFAQAETRILSLMEKSKRLNYPLIINTQGTVTDRISSKHRNLGAFPSRPSDYEMSDEEIHARDYLVDCMKHNIQATHMINKIFLTDSECYHIAKNYIYSYSDIRMIFKSPVYAHYTSPTRRCLITKPNIQDIPRKLCRLIKKQGDNNG